MSLARLPLALCIGLGASITAPWAPALELTASAELGARLNSNARRSSSEEDVDIVYTPGVSASAVHDGPGLTVGADYSVFRRIFQENFFDDETRLTGRGNVYWEALPERLDLRLSQRRSETTLQSFGRGTQDDRQIVSTTEAAPLLRFRTRGTDELQFEYIYTDTHTDEDNIDSQRQSLTARYLYSISPNTSLSLAGTQGETQYDLRDVPNVDFTTYTATLSSNRGRNSFALTGGYAIYERDGEDDAKGPIWNIRWTTEFASSTAFTLSGERRITDRSQDLLNIQSNQGFGDFEFENTDLTDVFELTSAEVSATRAFGATNGTARVSWQESDYERIPRDESRVIFEVSATRLIRRDLEGSAEFRFSDIDYEQLDAGYKQYSADARLLWDVNRRFEAEGGVFFQRRDGSGLAGDYDDYGAYLTARYFFAGQNQQGRTRR